MVVLALVCEVCNIETYPDGKPIVRHGPYAEFDTKNLSTPIMGSMFQWIDKAHYSGNPFPPSVDWLNMKCPMCGRRPFKYPDKILTPGGYHEIKEKEKVKVYFEGELVGTRKFFSVTTSEKSEEVNLGIPPFQIEIQPIETFVCEVCGKECKSKHALNGHKGKHKK